MNLIKTDVGQKAFKERSPLFSARQRAAFILFDGQKSISQVLLATGGLGVSATDVDYMVEQGFLSMQAPASAAPSGAKPDNLNGQGSAGKSAEKSADGASNKTPEQRYLEAKPIATQLTASLGLRGFRLNLSVEAATGYDDLLSLLPRIQEAVGNRASRPLERALKS